MRTKQYYKDAPKTIHSYYVPHEKNPCGCGSNVYHYEYRIPKDKYIKWVSNNIKNTIYL